MTKRHPMFALTIDDHGVSGDGLSGKYGSCTDCKRTNKVVGFSTGTCIMPRLVFHLSENQRPANGCEAQRGTRPPKKRAS